MCTVWPWRSKVTEWVEQWICIKFCIKLEHLSVESIWMILKAAALSSWSLAASSQQHALSCITSHAEFFGQISNYTGDSVPLQSRFGALWLLAFPKTRGRDFRPSVRFRKIRRGSWWRLGELCEVPRCLLWRGLRCHFPLYNVSCVLFNKCLIFLHHMAGFLLESPPIWKWNGWVIW